MPTSVSAMNSSKLLIKLGNGASPETFTHPCMINTSRGIEFSGSPTETLIPFCSPDEDLAGWIDREMDSLTATITGAGIFDSLSLDTFWDWFESGLSKNIQVTVNLASALEGGYWAGAAVLTGFNVNGAGRREKVNFDATIMSDGVWAWTDV